MKTKKKVLAVVLCIVMLATSMLNDGWGSVIKLIRTSAMAGYEQNYNDTRVELDFNKDWLFAFSDDEASYLKGFDDSDWEKVDLPHDFSMSQEFTTEDTEAESGHLPGGTGWYRKWFNLYEYYTGDHIFLNFEGAYQHTYVYVNGKYVGENHYGYNSFSFEISDYLVCSNSSQNLIAVKVVNDIPNSRWYSGSGINRDVTLSIAGGVHTALYGPRLTTPYIQNGDGTVEAKINIHNDTAISKKVYVEATILDDEHNPVSDTVVSSKITVPAKTEKEVVLSPSVDSPELWTLDNPTLYKLRTIIKGENGELIDEYHTTFGYRYVEWANDGGFKLNGENMKLKGVCLHHDQGALGAVQEYEAIYRQLVTLKEMGCNAIRTSHNTTSKTVINICNELGILVVEEFFDGWDASKNYNENDFSKYFLETIDESNTIIGAKGQKWYEFVIEQTIYRDEHDPCVIAWDVGNELGNITEGESTENYAEIAESIDNLAGELDPSRVIFHGNNRPFDSTMTMIDEKMDVIGGNYSPDGWSYIMTDPTDPRSQKPFVSTEAASAINSRGVYYTMGQDDENKQCTSYDTLAVSWGNEAAEAWAYVVENDWFSGEFIWTGFDYIGEPTPWLDGVPVSEDATPNSSYFGVVDTAGFEKDSYYLYRSWWNEESTTLHLVPGSWNRDKLALTNGYANVAVYSNAKTVKLFLNGQHIATAESDVVTTPAGYTYKTWTENVVDASKCSVGSFYTGKGDNLYSQFSVKYEEGTLSVKAYDENGNEITDTVGSTKSVSGIATQVATSVWQNRDTFLADGNDYIYVEFEARDADGNFMNDYNGTLDVKVDDSSARYAKIVGVDNGNPATTEKFQQSSVILSDSEAKIQMFNGRALVILRTTDEEGTINVTAVASDGTSSFSTQGVTVTSVAESGIQLTDEFDEVIRQNGKKYQVTLYDEFEVVKYHVNKLEKPQGGSSTGGSNSGSGSTDPNAPYQIFLADGSILNGYYVINSKKNANMNKDFVLSGQIFDGWAVAGSDAIYDGIIASNSAYTYESFNTDDGNAFEFVHQGGSNYYIKNKATGEYLYVDNYMLLLGDTPQEFSVTSNGDGSVTICSNALGFPLYVCREWEYFYLVGETTEDTKMWLYSKPNASSPETPSIPDSSVPYSVYTVDSNGIAGGEYVINSKYNPSYNNNDYVMSGNIYDGWSVAGSTSIYDGVTASDSAYTYEKFNTDDINVFKFIHQSGDKYYIQNKTTGEYLYVTNYMLLLGDTPQEFSITPNGDGSVTICSTAMGFPLYVSRQWEYFEVVGSTTEYTKMWLYSKQQVVSSEKLGLYNALKDSINEDTARYTRKSFEALLDAIEEGVRVFNYADSTTAEYATATQAIYAAIDALEMDIKKIDGTLFKYGYSNVNGTPDYSAGGILMNNISIEKMKQAILADNNLVNQIKEIIGYNRYNWADGYADAVVEGVAEAYARIYTLQFTGVPYNGSSDRNAVSNYPALEYCTWPTLSLWNVWTKDNTHGANDPVLNNEPVYDGASVQGLAGSTLEKGVIASHTAYDQPLSYANDGHDDMYDVTNYTYSFDTGTSYETVTLDYLSGISVYFPDLFSREALDANGNVTTATTGEFAKYYWDAEFPIFISTDEYGVNTYHFDSKDTNFLVQSSFDDSNHKVDMELNEVGSWNAYGSHSGSGFFPFNYKQGTTDYTGENAIYHYGFTFEHDFYIPKGGKHANGEDVVFNFSGDDDVYVYIDGVLVLDNGGLHGAREVTINFTDCTINYQYAMDVTDGQLKGGEYEHTYAYNKLVEDTPEAATYNADTVAALNKLHEVITDGQVHTLNFFYLERGASDSNCRMSFNLSETSEEVKIVDQTLTFDYGLPVEYNITENNNISQAAIDNNVKVEYIGLCAVNEDVTSTYTFELPEIIVPFEEGVTYNVEGMKYGTCTIDKEGNMSYTINSTNMAESEHFYVCAKITGDPTYAEDVVYYQIERTTFVPATAIYYEDTFETITYINGKVPANYDNSANEYGIWKTDGVQETTLKQNADLIDSEANPYGYETNYMSFAEYSGGSVHYVDVSAKNNPSSKFSGGSGAQWPTVEFSFTGTGFDLISITDCTTGAFSVTVKDKNNNIVRNTPVDTFYGYNYGQIFMNDEGEPTLDPSLTTMYKAEDGTCTSEERYYDENGAITDVPHYYDADGIVTETENDNPAYAYAYGWVVAEDGAETKDTLYQIPVIKITDLEYGSYDVTITPTFTTAFKHSSTAADGTSYYRVYLDAIKIYSPAGENEGITDEVVKNAYSTDDELYPNYLELKNMLIGADSLGEITDKQGVIFIDGIAALENDIETYRDAGPNNELYLAEGQAVAFEIWATAVPTDIQIGAKLACGNPALTVSYASKTTELRLATATDLYYSLNSIMPSDGKLVWKQVTAADGNNYYTTGTVVIQNTGDVGSVLSITNLKWTFSHLGGKGYFRIPTPVENEVLKVAATSGTTRAAYSLLRMRTAALDIEQVGEPAVVTDAKGNSVVSIKLNASADVASLVVTDKNGNPLPSDKVACFISQEETDGVVEWTVRIRTTEIGDITYLITGAYENGYVDESKVVTVDVTINSPSGGDKPSGGNNKPNTDSDNSLYDAIARFFKRISDFFRALFSPFGNSI
jgi:fibro-slime domain-containing protein